MDYIRALVIRLHVVLGLVGGLFFAIFGVTGAALAYRPSLETSLYSPKTATVPHAAGLGTAIDNALQRNPGMKVREVRFRPGRAWEVVLHERNGMNPKSIYADPASGATVATRMHSDSALDWIYRLHTDWFLGRFGLQLASRFALLLLLQGVLGLMVWTLRGHPFHAHALLGVTAGIGAILMAYSGWRILTVPVTSVTPVVTLRGVENLAPLDQLVQTAERRRPGGQIDTIYFPQAPSQPFQFWFGQRPGDGIVYMDPYGSVIPMMLPPSTNAALDWHSGPAGGSLLRFLRLLTGLGLAGLFATGAWRRWKAR